MAKKPRYNESMKRKTIWIDPTLWDDLSAYLPERSKSEKIRQLLTEWLYRMKARGQK